MRVIVVTSTTRRCKNIHVELGLSRNQATEQFQTPDKLMAAIAAAAPPDARAVDNFFRSPVAAQDALTLDDLIRCGTHPRRRSRVGGRRLHLASGHPHPLPTAISRPCSTTRRCSEAASVPDFDSPADHHRRADRTEADDPRRLQPRQAGFQFFEGFVGKPVYCWVWR